MKLIEELKKNSSKWVKTQWPEYSAFYWQNWYGIFSVNPSEVDKVVAYIQNQKEHHTKQDFKDELLTFLRKYKLEYDEKYLRD